MQEDDGRYNVNDGAYLQVPTLSRTLASPWQRSLKFCFLAAWNSNCLRQPRNVVVCEATCRL
jgi:hypothetical protein